MIKRRLKEQAGFTLIEMLIVVILLGILAMLIIPQISVSTGDANLNTLKSNLSSMRNTIELYYHQHNQVYPGANKIDGTAGPNDAESATAFLQQLTTYTDINGDCQNTSDATHTYGPYLKSTVLPTNPYNNLNDASCDVSQNDITNRTLIAPETAWAFHPTTGVLFANDTGGHNLL